MNSIHSDHERLTEALSAYLDDALPDAEHADLERHLSACEECRAELDNLRGVRALLRALPEPSLPRSFALHTTTAAPISAGREAPSRRAPRWTGVAQWSGGLVAAVGAGLLFIGALSAHPLTVMGGASSGSYAPAFTYSSATSAQATIAPTTPVYGSLTPSINPPPSNTRSAQQPTTEPGGGVTMVPGASVTPAPTPSAYGSAETYAPQQSASSPLVPTGATLLIGGGAALTAGSVARRRKRRAR